MSQRQIAEATAGKEATAYEEVKERGNPLKLVGLAALILAALVFPLVFTSSYHQHVVILILTYALMAVGWNVLGGYTGQISLGNTVFFGIGAYSTAFLLNNYLLSPWVGMLVGIALSTVAAMAIGYPCFRLGGHYFAIATIAVGEILYTVVLNSPPLGGAVGISMKILPESLINLEFHGSNKAPYYYIILAFLALALVAVYWIERSKLGYYFRAIKEDQQGARALGVNASRYKMIAFIISAVMTSIAGTFYAQYVLFIDPYSVIYLQISIAMCLMAVLGGLGTLWGPVIGATVLIGIQEVARVALGGSGNALDLVIYGLLVMVVAVYQPTGLMGLAKRFRQRKA